MLNAIKTPLTHFNPDNKGYMGEKKKWVIIILFKLSITQVVGLSVVLVISINISKF